MADTTVTLALEGQVPLREFAEAIDGFSDLVEALSTEVGAGARIQWTVEALEAGSAIATARGDSDDRAAVESVARAFLEVGRAEEHREPIPYSPKVKRAAERIAHVLNTKITAVRFETAEGEATVYSHSAAAPDRPVLKAHGAVTGRVQTLSNRGALRFTVFDLLNDRAVSCYLEPGHEELMRGVWGRIATVEGWITRDARTGRPLSVRRVTQVYPRPDDEPGGFRQARGAVHTGKGVISAEAAIRRLRDA